ncbi:MAG: hypothetical protein ACK41Q_10870 [Candidatus Brocadia sp.]
MKTLFFITFCLCLIVNIAYPVFDVHAQEMQTNATTTAQAQSTQVTPPELPPTPRSKLEIIQYILLPFAIGAAIWLILRLEKMEREEGKGNEEE